MSNDAAQPSTAARLMELESDVYAIRAWIRRQEEKGTPRSVLHALLERQEKKIADLSQQLQHYKSMLEQPMLINNDGTIRPLHNGTREDLESTVGHLEIICNHLRDSLQEIPAKAGNFYTAKADRAQAQEWIRRMKDKYK